MMSYSMGGLFSSEREKDLQTKLAECKKSLGLSSEREKDLQTALNTCNESLQRSRRQNTRLQGINTNMTLNENKPKTGGKRTQKYRRRK